MNRLLFCVIGISVMFAFTSLKPGDDLKMDWSKITDKNYVVTYVRVVYDSSSKEAINANTRMYSTNDVVKVFSKNSVKLIKDLIQDKSNYSTEQEDDMCKSNYFPYAIIVTKNDEVQGVINIGCQERVWNFEPKAKCGELIVLNEKGLKLQEELFNLKK